MPIKLVMLDVDGVMTDGTKAYDENHNVISKSYCDRDFTAIKRIKDSGINVCLLSGDKRINKGMADGRGIDFYFSRDKPSILNEILSRYNCSLLDTVYVGDDIFDIPVLSLVGFPFCPRNAPIDVKMVCSHVLKSDSGDSVVAELYDTLTSAGLIPKSMLGVNYE